MYMHAVKNLFRYSFCTILYFYMGTSVTVTRPKNVICPRVLGMRSRVLSAHAARMLLCRVQLLQVQLYSCTAVQ